MIVHGITPQLANVFLSAIYGQFSPISNRLAEILKGDFPVQSLWGQEGSGLSGYSTPMGCY